MMQLRGDIIFRLQIIEKTLPDDLGIDVRRNLQSILDDIDEAYLPIEQQAFEDAFDDALEESKFRDICMPHIENGKDYYNQTYKS